MTSRRNFLKSSALLSASAMIVPSVISCGGGAKKSSSKKEMGIQIYTIREQLNADLNGALKKLAEIGYNSIEAAGFANAGGAYQFYGKSPKEFSKMLDDLGMKLVSSHTTFDLDKADAVCAAHAEAGCKYIVYPFLPENLRPNLDGYKAVGDMLNKMGEAAQKSGIQLGYHNHAFEYTELEGQVPMDVMMASTDPKLVQYEIDIYWTVKAGKDPIEYFNKYPGRFELWHVKDIDNTPDKFFAPVGSGTINWEQVFAAKDKAGMKHFFVEEDRTKGDIWEDITKSYNFLNNAKFVS
jgi:sugar phosphate isomerase/epimerase